MSRAPLTEVTVDEASRAYIGRWNRLVSTTNWEKGRIIHEWRAALQASAAAATESSDEAWSRLVGGVTGQHVGRLRRVYERFGDAHQEYEGLYWSHFQAVLDWDDAEMWLEGSLQNNWSVSQMRRQRWEALGAVQGQEPRDPELVSVEVDEDFSQDAADPMEAARDGSSQILTSDGAFVAEARSPAGPDFGDESDVPTRPHEIDPALSGDTRLQSPTVAALRPFENLPQLPADLAECFESFQLAILRHKANGWQEISREDLVASLDALKSLTLAPSSADP